MVEVRTKCQVKIKSQVTICCCIKVPHYIKTQNLLRLCKDLDDKCQIVWIRAQRITYLACEPQIMSSWGICPWLLHKNYGNHFIKICISFFQFNLYTSYASYYQIFADLRNYSVSEPPEKRKKTEF